MTGLMVSAQSASKPQLSVQQRARDEVTLNWLGPATGFVLEQTEDPTLSGLWEPVPTPVIEEEGLITVTVSSGVTSRFFRLRKDLFTRVEASSPADGETGVAVIRETIVHFSAPLANDSVIRPDNFYAGFGGRRLLSRSELSADRRQASLFYLEPLPGSTRVQAVFDGAGLTDEAGRPLDPDGDGVQGGQALIAFDTLSLTALPGTAVVGRVFASELVPGSDTGTNAVNRPLAGVIITVDGREQDLRATTDAQGRFTLSPVPPGRFFVKIDGRLATGSSYPDGAYYPFVGKAWESVAGRTNTLAGGTGEIFLPLIQVGTLQTTSATRPTTITFPDGVVAANPALAGVSLTVPANALFSDDGTRGGMVGIAPVPPDRLPGPLPQGASIPLIITVQTDGALNFDRPVPICFPNLANPITGKAWPPGTRGSLISFNHRKGIWEAAGGMTVGADGRLFCSDPGVGIRQPGWHGVQCPKPADPPPPPPPDDPCKQDPVQLKQCFDACLETGSKCHEIAVVIYKQNLALCSAVRSLGQTKKANECLKAATANLKGRDSACLVEAGQCSKACIACSGTPIPGGAAPQSASPRGLAGLHGSDPDPIQIQITALLMTIQRLVEPYLDPDSEIPVAVTDQIDVLTAQIDALAGGDAVPYLINRMIEAERANAAVLDDLSLNRGNAPAYPVWYATEIARTNGPLTLRGETAPRGQYLLFVPPDGILGSVAFYDPRTRHYGEILPFYRPEARYGLPRFSLAPLDPDSLDTDGDTLPDVAEFVLGTNPTQADTDGDGISDAAELEQGTNPLDGLPTVTGIIATAPTPGPTVDVCALNDLVILAAQDKGVSIFSAGKGMNPILVAQVDTPGIAQRVACSGDFIAVADGAAGLAIIDVRDPAAARRVHQLDVGGAAQAVATAGDLGFVGLDSGQLVMVDLGTGTILESIPAGGAIHDLGLEGDVLFVLLESQLRTYRFADGTLQFLGNSDPPGFIPDGISRLRRLFVGGGYAYVTSYPGYDTYDVRDPSALNHVGHAVNLGPNSFKQIVLNGSGLGVAVVGVNPRPDGTHDVSLYDVSNPAATTILTVLPTPGLARAVSLYNGLAYVADGEAGLQVVNYLPYDSRGTRPTIALSASFTQDGTNGVTEEGRLVRVTAGVTDDVQVRNVEFYVDGVKVQTDGTFPFEYRFIAPTRSPTKSTFTLRACASDTGGNTACSTTYTLTLVPDNRPLFARTSFPGPRSISTAASAVSVAFNKPIDVATLRAATFTLTFAGGDNRLDSDDDVQVGGGVFAWRDSFNLAVLSFPGALPAGWYRGSVTTGVQDLAGNPLRTPFVWTFWVLPAGADADDDDDGLPATEEVPRGLNPFYADTDGDGWTDGVEVADGTDPLRPDLTPRSSVMGLPLVELLIPETEAASGTRGITIGQPPIEIGFFDPDQSDPSTGTTIGRPNLEIHLPVLDEIDGFRTGITLGVPPISLRFAP